MEHDVWRRSGTIYHICSLHSCVRDTYFHPIPHRPKVHLGRLFLGSSLGESIVVCVEAREKCMLNPSKVVFTGAYMPVGALLVHAPMGVHQWNITLRGLGRYLFVC